MVFRDYVFRLDGRHALSGGRLVPPLYASDLRTMDSSGTYGDVVCSPEAAVHLSPDDMAVWAPCRRRVTVLQARTWGTGVGLKWPSLARARFELCPSSPISDWRMEETAIWIWHCGSIF
jgi:hypothetical protein